MPVRDPLEGSASKGHWARSASARAGGPASSPATTTVRGPSEISVASSKVAAIVEAAERAAEDLRMKTEEKVRATLHAASVDDEVRELLEAGRLEREAEVDRRDDMVGLRIDHQKFSAQVARCIQSALGIHL